MKAAPHSLNRNALRNACETGAWYPETRRVWKQALAKDERLRYNRLRHLYSFYAVERCYRWDISRIIILVAHQGGSGYGGADERWGEYDPVH